MLFTGGEAASCLLSHSDQANAVIYPLKLHLGTSRKCSLTEKPLPRTSLKPPDSRIKGFILALVGLSWDAGHETNPITQLTRKPSSAAERRGGGSLEVIQLSWAQKVGTKLVLGEQKKEGDLSLPEPLLPWVL